MDFRLRLGRTVAFVLFCGYSICGIWLFQSDSPQNQPSRNFLKDIPKQSVFETWAKIH